MISNTRSVSKQHTATTSYNIDNIQRYSNIMENVLKNYFPELNRAPDALYILMATMGYESSYRMVHKQKEGSFSTNHALTSNTSGTGKKYWNDPVIVPLRDSSDSTIREAIREGLSAKALMGTMGWYQVRGCRLSNDLLALRNYRSIAESTAGVIVAPGVKPSSVFTNDDSGATKSIILGCMIFEEKYLRYSKIYDKNTAMAYAIMEYVGRQGAKDVLGTSPEMRLAQINNSSSDVSKGLKLAGLTRSNESKVFVTRKPESDKRTETKTEVAASTHNLPATKAGCA